jgi:hypothetical protein
MVWKGGQGLQDGKVGVWMTRRVLFVERIGSDVKRKEKRFLLLSTMEIHLVSQGTTINLPNI